MRFRPAWLAQMNGNAQEGGFRAHGAGLIRPAISAIDFLAAGVVATKVVIVTVHQRTRPARPALDSPKLLTFEGTYSLETIRERGLEHEITCRDVKGFFEHVWSVHPVVGADPTHSPGSCVGRPSYTQLNPRNTMVEGKVHRFKSLKWLPKLNFALGQSILIRELSRVVREEGIAIVRAGDPDYLGLLAWSFSWAHSLPLVVRVNANNDHIYAATGLSAYPRLFRYRALERRIERFVFSRADLVAPGSEDNREFALRNGARPERTTLFRYGTWIDPAHFEWDPTERKGVRDEVGLTDRPFVVLLSRLEGVKHPDDVLHVLAEARVAVPTLAALFVGSGTMMQELQDLAADMGLTSDVVFAGSRDQQWIARALADADVVVSPLTGRALVEACLSGTAVVAYDIEWQSEMIRHGETGLLVPYRDTEAMAAAVCSLLEAPDWAATLGRQGREHALEVMDPTKLFEQERSEYERLLGAKRGKRTASAD